MDGLMNWIVKIVKKRVMNFIIKELNNEEFKNEITKAIESNIDIPKLSPEKERLIIDSFLNVLYEQI